MQTHLMNRAIQTTIASILGIAPSPYRQLHRIAENLGDNCEFGFFQRSEQYEPSSLFRWAVTPLPKLITYLKAPGEIYARHNIRPHTEAMVFDAGTGFYFHSKLTQGTENGNARLIDESEGFSEIYAAEYGKMQYLADKFMHRLQNSPALYVVKANDPLDTGDVLELAAQIRRYNTIHRLLHVSQDDRFFLEEEAPGVYHGTLPKFADYSAADQIDKAGWKRLLVSLADRPDIKALTAHAEVSP